MGDRRHYLNARNTLNALLDLGALPIVNENDTVSTDEIKFVLAARADYEWMRDTIHSRRLADRTPNLLASTVFGKLAPSELVAWVLEDALAVRVQLQLHKYVWAASATGV